MEWGKGKKKGTSGFREKSMRFGAVVVIRTTSNAFRRRPIEFPRAVTAIRSCYSFPGITITLSRGIDVITNWTRIRVRPLPPCSLLNVRVFSPTQLPPPLHQQDIDFPDEGVGRDRLKRTRVRNHSNNVHVSRRTAETARPSLFYEIL